MNSLEIHKSRFFKDTKSVSSFFILISFKQSAASGTRFQGSRGRSPKNLGCGFPGLTFTGLSRGQKKFKSADLWIQTVCVKVIVYYRDRFEIF